MTLDRIASSAHVPLSGKSSCEALYRFFLFWFSGFALNLYCIFIHCVSFARKRQQSTTINSPKRHCYCSRTKLFKPLQTDYSEMTRQLTSYYINELVIFTFLQRILSITAIVLYSIVPQHSELSVCLSLYHHPEWHK